MQRRLPTSRQMPKWNSPKCIFLVWALPHTPSGFIVAPHLFPNSTAGVINWSSIETNGHLIGYIFATLNSRLDHTVSGPFEGVFGTWSAVYREAMAKDYNLTSRRFELMGPWPSGAGRAGDQNSSWWSSVAEATTSEGSNWTTSSKYATLDSCGPSEYIFIFYAYYYGLMFLVSIIGVVGNTAVIRPVDLLYTMSRKKQLERFRSVLYSVT